MNYFNGQIYQRESLTLPTKNPLVDMEKPIQEVTEAVANDLKLKEIRAIYPLIKGINSNRLTRNYTFYPRESLIGSNSKTKRTGYSSFVLPYGKPIITEHRFQDGTGFLGSGKADAPMGRILAASYNKREGGDNTVKKGYPGTVEGDGHLAVIAAITDQDQIPKILGHALHTVSVGTVVESVIESISGQDIVQARKNNEELPPFQRGQTYDGKLSYWIMGPVAGRELSFVNNPSDEMAGVCTPDVGYEGIRMMLADKKVGKNNEFNFFDAATGEKIEWDLENAAFDTSYIVDSSNVGNNIWWLSGKEHTINHGIVDGEIITESEDTSKIIEEGDCVTWNGILQGTVLSIMTEEFKQGSITYKASDNEKYVTVRSNINEKVIVTHKLQNLRLVSKKNGEQ